MIECAGTCITLRLQEGTSTGLSAGKSAHRQARYQRQPSAAFEQVPGTRALAFAEKRHKQRGLTHTEKTSCYLHAGQRLLTDGLRVRTHCQLQCRPTGRLPESCEGRCRGSAVKWETSRLLRRHNSRVISTRPSPHLLRIGTMHYERKHSVLQLAYSEPD